ncbi:MAG: CDP-alcohol phosphatidyltransferase family protein [Dehalococcoidales bacterium]|nr:CDP-alcohol phosphatidyltransferase family protein [Dehalococcoidales bacterium]
MSRLEKTRKSLGQSLAVPLARALAKLHFTPNALTLLGFLIAAAAAVLTGMGYFLAGGAVYLFAGLFDMLDGALARLTGKTSRFGGVLDSSIDRISEGMVLIALIYVSSRSGDVAMGVLCGVAMLGSFMVSYIRARMEGAGIACQAGIFTRPERVIVLSLGLLLARFDYALSAVLGIIALFSWITVVERLVHAWRRAREDTGA